jgi:hypothetical protein
LGLLRVKKPSSLPVLLLGLRQLALLACLWLLLVVEVEVVVLVVGGLATKTI